MYLHLKCIYVLLSLPKKRANCSYIECQSCDTEVSPEQCGCILNKQVHIMRILVVKRVG